MVPSAWRIGVIVAKWRYSCVLALMQTRSQVRPLHAPHRVNFWRGCGGPSTRGCAPALLWCIAVDVTAGSRIDAALVS